MPNYVQGPPYPRGLYSGDKGYSFGALTTAAFVSTAPARTANGQVTARIALASPTPIVGEIVTIVGSQPVGGTRFDGNYILLTRTVASQQILTLLPVDDVLLHQAIDTFPIAGATLSYMGMEQPVVAQAGTAFGLIRDSGSDATPTTFYADGQFDASPGVFEVDVEIAQVDQPTAYATAAGGVITALNANNAFHVAIIDQANFARLTLKSRANAVNFAGTLRA